MGRICGQILRFSREILYVAESNEIRRICVIFVLDSAIYKFSFPQINLSWAGDSRT
ncbi:hypothetical protein ACWIUD_08130 [Helicobacter sp. 23-1044]